MKAPWHFRTHDETFGADGQPREVYRTLFDRLNHMPRAEVRDLDERLEATMREMGVSFDIHRERPWSKRGWFCDLLPQIFTPEEWEPLAAGVRQRLRAFELFLRDIYSERRILHDGVLPVAPVMGSEYFQRAAAGVPTPGGSFLHLSGIAVCRLPDGRLAVKHHYFANASGISYMIQNRRALTRVIPQSFHDAGIHSISDVPTGVVEMLRAHSSEPDPMVVLLTPGPLSPAYSEHSFLGRRMGIPLVQGGDLLVLNDKVYLKTVSGLDKVDVIYTRLSDRWLDPIAFRRDSMIGVPGLVHCIRKQSVTVVNGIGAQLADDRALLPFSTRIIRYYLGESPLLPTVPTYWLGDIDQREMVLANLEDFTVRILYGERIVLGGDGHLPTEKKLTAARAEIMKNPSHFVAQPQACDAETVSFQDGDRKRRRQDHIVFAMRQTDGELRVFPGALTRVSTTESEFTSSELGGGSKDTWVRTAANSPSDEWDPSLQIEGQVPSHAVTSRVADAYYWMGRYLERAYDLAGMIGGIESVELEELNPVERTNYRPVWNRILPRLEGAAQTSRRTISNPEGRYRLTCDPSEPGSIAATIQRAFSNAESVLETLSLEAWGVMSLLREKFDAVEFDPTAPAEELSALTRSLCLFTRQSVPQFFGTAKATMLADDGWSFCEIGQLLERACITANAVTSLSASLPEPATAGPQRHAREIRLSAFLRMLGSRDIYRRVYQMRIEPLPMLDLLWKNPVAPRSVLHCLSGCTTRIRENENSLSPATGLAVAGIEALLQAIQTTDWQSLLESGPSERAKCALQSRSEELLASLLDLHTTISDSFLNHQVLIHDETKPLFPE